MSIRSSARDSRYGRAIPVVVHPRPEPESHTVCPQCGEPISLAAHQTGFKCPKCDDVQRFERLSGAAFARQRASLHDQGARNLLQALFGEPERGESL